MRLQSWTILLKFGGKNRIFIKNGGGGYAEPGMIISEFDNTATDFIESKIVDPSTDTFTIQLKLSDSDNGSLGGHICYNVMGEVTSVT